MIDQSGDRFRFIRSVERLDRQPHMVAHDLIGRTPDPRHFGAYAPPKFGQPPQKGRQPGDAGFNQHHLERGIFGENTLADQARDLRLKALRLRAIILGVPRRPAERGDRMPIARSGVNTDRQTVALRGLEYRPVFPPAERRLAHGENQHLHEATIRSAALDLGDRVIGVLHRHDDRSAQPRIAIEPLFGDPIIDRLGERRRHVLAEKQLHAVKAITDRDIDIPAIERLRAQRIDVVGWLAGLAAPIGARRQRGIGRIVDRTPGNSGRGR